MAQAELPKDHLTDYERAICYFTLPRVVAPITYGLIVAYAVCLFEAFGALVIGVLLKNSTWTTAGIGAVTAIVLLGVIAFYGRAVRNEVRRRKVLALAKGVPDAGDAEDSPDPFANHVLLKHPVNAQGSLFCCTEENSTIRYFVEYDGHSRAWNVRTAQDEEACRVIIHGGSRSFLFGSGVLNNLSVEKDGTEVAHIASRFSLTEPATEIRCLAPEAHQYLVRRDGVHHEGRLVGRIYELRRTYYLDVEEEHLNEGVLGYFVSKI